MTNSTPRSFYLWLSLPLAALLVLSSYGGLFWPAVYSRETPLWAAQAKGGDVVNLVVAVPVLLVSAVLGLRKSIAAQLIWLGTLLFLLYNFLIYALAVRFNSLFLVYCVIFGISFYSFVIGLTCFSSREAAALYSPRAPVKTIAMVFLLVAAVFGVQWLHEIVPALLSGVAPKSVSETGLPTNPIHFLDLSVALPGYVIAAVMLLRRMSAGYVWAPILLTLGILMFLAIAAMVIAMSRNGAADGRVPVLIFVSAAAGGALLLAKYLRTR